MEENSQWQARKLGRFLSSLPGTYCGKKCSRRTGQPCKCLAATQQKYAELKSKSNEDDQFGRPRRLSHALLSHWQARKLGRFLSSFPGIYCGKKCSRRTGQPRECLMGFTEIVSLSAWHCTDKLTGRTEEDSQWKAQVCFGDKCAFSCMPLSNNLKVVTWFGKRNESCKKVPDIELLTSKLTPLCGLRMRAHVVVRSLKLRKDSDVSLNLACSMTEKRQRGEEIMVQPSHTPQGLQKWYFLWWCRICASWLSLTQSIRRIQLLQCYRAPNQYIIKSYVLWRRPLVSIGSVTPTL